MMLHTDKAYDSKGNRAYCGSVGSPRGLPGVGWSPRPPLAGSLEGRAIAVVVELLSAVAGAWERDSARFFAVVLLACALVASTGL